VNIEEDTTQQKNRPKKKLDITTPKIVYRPPEDWEINIIALERGEWIPNMSEEAFRKYKKERPKLKDALFFIEEKIDETSSSSNTSHSNTTNTSTKDTYLHSKPTKERGTEFYIILFTQSHTHTHTTINIITHLPYTHTY
jgi:hypothetical protein